MHASSEAANEMRCSRGKQRNMIQVTSFTDSLLQAVTETDSTGKLMIRVVYCALLKDRRPLEREDRLGIENS